MTIHESHIPRNPNIVHKIEQDAAGFNQSIAIAMTHLFSSMSMFWLILVWLILWIAANATIAHFDPLPWPLLLCLASVPQLPLMIVIMVGQGVLGRHQELMAEEQFKTTNASYAELLRHTQLLLELASHHEDTAHE